MHTCVPAGEDGAVCVYEAESPRLFRATDRLVPGVAVHHPPCLAVNRDSSLLAISASQGAQQQVRGAAVPKGIYARGKN